LTYQPLPIIEVDLTELVLDLENYRIPTRPEDEVGALKYLFMSEDVLGAAKLILRDGYFDNEVPIVIADSSDSDGPPYIVLEGNRRVSALKVLNDPTLIPGHENEVRSLLKRYAVEADSLPERIRVIVASDRDTAKPHIARLHTGSPKKRWSRDQQATFYYSLLDDHTTVKDVKDKYPGVSIVRFMKMAVMRKFVTAAPFTDRSLREYSASDALAMSVFEYAYLRESIASAIGVKFDKDGLLLPRSMKPERIAAGLPNDKLVALEYLVGQFRANKLNTRSLEFKKGTPEHDQLVERLSDISVAPQGSDISERETPPVKPSISSSQERIRDAEASPSGSVGSDSEVEAPTMRHGRGPNHPDAKNKLDLTGIHYENTPVNLKVRYFELRKISPSDLPISTAILMRSILETTIKYHFESSGTPVSGTLRIVFKQVKKSYGTIKHLEATINSIDTGDKHKVGSIHWFDDIAHNLNASPAAGDIHQAWRMVNPIIRHLLRQAEDPIH